MIHIARNGKQEGPYSLEQIQASLQSGSLKPSDMAWWEGCAGWVPVSQIPGLNPGSSAAGSVQDIYSAPKSQLLPGGAGSGQVSLEAIEALRQTRPWVLFLAVLGALWAGFMLLGGIMALLAGVVGTASMASSSSGSSGGAGIPSSFPAAVMIGVAIMYLVFGGLYLFPVIKLFKYAGAIGALTRSGASADLENALRQQKGFWKFLGIMAIVGFIAMIGYFVVIIAVGGAFFTSALKSMPTSTPLPPTPSGAPASP